jgi:hypothetical protein
MRRMFLANQGKDKEVDSHVDKETIQATKDELKKSIKKLYDISDSEEDEE